MISINVRTSTVRRTVSREITSTPKEVFDELGIDTSSSHANLAGVMLSAADYNKSFEELGVQDGTETYLNAIVKADGAAF